MKSFREHIRRLLYSNCITKKLCQFRIAIKEWCHTVPPIYATKLLYPQKVFLVLTPEHGNMGDHAIAESEIRLLKQAGISFYEITEKKLQLLKRYHALNVLNGKCILVNGGGNLGTLWFWVEQLFRQIIENNPKSYIFCLPNTIYYEDSDWGWEELKQSREIYNAHKHLKLYAREKISYSIMKELYQDVSLVPDMVLSMDKSKEIFTRKGCLLCLRGDVERTRTDEQEEQIVRCAHDLFGENVSFTDMDIRCSVPLGSRQEALDQKYSEFKRAELVITDRLHGMIFSAITGTPCIVLDSKSPKLRGCYDWISQLKYIKFADSPLEIPALFQSIPDEIFYYDNRDLLPYYRQLQEDICAVAQRG